VTEETLSQVHRSSCLVVDKPICEGPLVINFEIDIASIPLNFSITLDLSPKMLGRALRELILSLLEQHFNEQEVDIIVMAAAALFE